jgi:hypothetical protein
MGIHQLDVKAALFAHFEPRHPGDPGRLQHDGLTLTLPQPIGQGVKLGRQGPKAVHRPRIAIRGHRHPMGVGPPINPGGIEIELLSLRGARPFGMTLA